MALTSGSGSSEKSGAGGWPVRRTVSAGGVVVRPTPEGPRFAMIRHRTIKRELVWSLPKGQLEDGESPQDAALREVREETGIDAEIVGPLDDVTYWFAWPPERVRYRKTVHFFLMRARVWDLSEHDEEVEEVGFFSLEDAVDRARYPSETKLLRKAARAARDW